MNSPNLSSPLRSLKVKPELIAGEFVNLTPDTVAAFLQRHRWRLLFPESDTVPKLQPGARVLNPETINWDVDAEGREAPGQFQGDEREADPETGEPIPGTQRTLKTWKSAELAKEAEFRPCKRCKTITKHVLVNHRYVCQTCRNGLQSVLSARDEISKRLEEATLLKWASLLGGMWERGKAAEARQAMEQIFAAERPAFWNENLQRWSKTLPLERSAVQITRRGFTFQRRDLLDAVAWTILQASRRGFLRRCKDNGCQAPLFVAMHPRQVYCFACGVEAEKRRKRNWARKSRAPKSRQRAASAVAVHTVNSQNPKRINTFKIDEKGHIGEQGVADRNSGITHASVRLMRFRRCGLSIYKSVAPWTRISDRGWPRLIPAL